MRVIFISGLAAFLIYCWVTADVHINEEDMIHDYVTDMYGDVRSEYEKVLIDLSVYGGKNTSERIQPITQAIIHNTANAKEWANGMHHIIYMDTTKREVSWDYTVDDVAIIKHHCSDRKTWHAGACNTNSIGIEVCMHEGINISNVLRNLEILRDQLETEYPGIVFDTHENCTGKKCPSWPPLVEWVKTNL